MFVVEYSRFSFIFHVKTAAPLKEITLSFPVAPSKNRSCQAPSLFFQNLVGGSTPLAAESGVGGCTLWWTNESSFFNILQRLCKVTWFIKELFKGALIVFHGFFIFWGMAKSFKLVSEADLRQGIFGNYSR